MTHSASQLEAQEHYWSSIQAPRRGKWTVEEEDYAKKLISTFTDGHLPVPDGTTLRALVADRLKCDPMRVTKKFAGNSRLGKKTFRKAERNPVDSKVQQRALEELKKLEGIFIARLMKNAERPSRRRRRPRQQGSSSDEQQRTLRRPRGLSTVSSLDDDDDDDDEDSIGTTVDDRDELEIEMSPPSAQRRLSETSDVLNANRQEQRHSMNTAKPSQGKSVNVLQKLRHGEQAANNSCSIEDPPKCERGGKIASVEFPKLDDDVLAQLAQGFATQLFTHSPITTARPVPTSQHQQQYYTTNQQIGASPLQSSAQTPPGAWPRTETNDEDDASSCATRMATGSSSDTLPYRDLGSPIQQQPVASKEEASFWLQPQPEPMSWNGGGFSVPEQHHHHQQQGLFPSDSMASTTSTLESEENLLGVDKDDRDFIELMVQLAKSPQPFPMANEQQSFVSPPTPPSTPEEFYFNSKNIHHDQQQQSSKRKRGGPNVQQQQQQQEQMLAPEQQQQTSAEFCFDPLFLLTTKDPMTAMAGQQQQQPPSTTGWSSTVVSPNASISNNNEGTASQQSSFDGIRFPAAGDQWTPTSSLQQQHSQSYHSTTAHSPILTSAQPLQDCPAWSWES